jgi:hypothetical protein
MTATPEHPRTPSQILRDLLTRHPEAASLQGEASHRQALARESAARVARRFAAELAARLHYEELAHRLDPRRRRTVHFGLGLVLLFVLGTELTMLDVIELSGLLSDRGALLPALAAAAVWLTGGWLATQGGRSRRSPLVLGAISAAVLLGLLLAALHGFLPQAGPPATLVWVPLRALFGVLLAVFICALTVGAAVLMAHMEPASLFLARRRWHQARAAREAAAQTATEDTEAASVATEAWLGLVRAAALSAAGDDERLVHGTVELAADLLASGRLQLPPPLH